MIAVRQARHKRLVLINRDFQLRYTKAAVGVGVLSTVLTSVAILYPLYTFGILRIPRFLPLPILAAMVAAVVLNIFFVGLLGVFITHRVAGPMYSLVRHFRRIGLGQFGHGMRLREDDDLRFVARNFNEMQECLAQMTRDDLALVEAALVEITQVSAGPSAAREGLERLCADFKRRLAH